MPSSLRVDIGLNAAIIAALPILVLFVGNPLYIGIWYYLLVPTAFFIVGAVFKGEPRFISGGLLAVVITFLVYMLINSRAEKPEGLLALGHLFSLPGAVLGLVVGILLSKRSPLSGSALVFGMGWTLAGFLINQVVVCNTVMWCGPLSWPLAKG